MEVIIVLLTILCICDAVRLGLEIRQLMTGHTKTEPKRAPAPKQEDQIVLAQQRKQFEDEMEAFQQLMNYSADIAYGIPSKETE